jgi:hypothetical protein
VLDNGEGRAPRQRPGPATTITTYSKLILPERQRWAVAKVRRQDELLRVCRELEQNGASLVTYYTRPWWSAA